ncbi:MAG: DUF2194 domain-containing protein [Candidatus Bathyarchaeia archaeon]
MNEMRSKFAIRDDDVCFFTNWQDLDHLYAPLWSKVPISFSVIPFAVLHRGNQMQLCKGLPGRPIHENKDLVEFLKGKVKNNEIEIMLHGYSHEYCMIKGRYVGEYLWKPKEQLIKQTLEGKQYLEELFGISIQVFVPPSNMIGKAGIIAIEAANLNLNGIMGRWNDRPLSFSYFKAYLRRWIYRCLKGKPYPFPIIVGKHIELVAYSLTPVANLQWLYNTMRGCFKTGAPFVLAVHHWELLENLPLRLAFFNLINEALDMGYIPSTVSQCILGGRER